MKLTTITMALAFAAGTLGLGSAVTAQDHRPPTDQGMRHDDGMRHDEGMRHDDGMRRNDMGRDRATHIRRDVRHYERHDRRGWGHDRRHCRTTWRHHRRVTRCW